MYGRQKLRCQICHYINKTFDFVPPRAFDFDQKTYTKRCTSNSLLSRDKTISSWLDLICHVLSISEYILEKH